MRLMIDAQNKTAPVTKMLSLDESSCSIRLPDFFVVLRVFLSCGATSYRIWNRSTTDWEAHSLYDYIQISATENHTLLIRLPEVTELTSWAETMNQAYASCQTIDPHPPPSRKGKERASE